MEVPGRCRRVGVRQHPRFLGWLRVESAGEQTEDGGIDLPLFDEAPRVLGALARIGLID